MLSAPAVSHPPWPHRHVSAESALLKLALLSALLAGAACFAATRAWQWWRNRRSAPATGRPLQRRGPRRKR